MMLTGQGMQEWY